MSDSARMDTRQWSRPGLVLAVLGAAAIMVFAAGGQGYLYLAAGAAAAFFGLGVYVAAPRVRASRIDAAPPSDASALPDTARDLLESLDDPILVLDASGRVVLANRASHAIIGADTERKRISSVLRTPEVLEAVERVLAGGAPENIDFTIPVPVERHLRAYIAASVAAGANPPSVLVQFHDLTAVRRAEEMRADFVANASHELRTPLAAVSGFIDTLRGHAKNDADARERFLEIMSIETGRMSRLIDDLLSLTRIELNEHNPPSGKCDLVALVRGAAAALAPLAEADGIAIRLGPSEPLAVIGDRDELTQVFQNLLHNAIKYGRERGAVRISFGTSAAAARRGVAGEAYAAIEDEGEGIAREAIPRLTERFYRVDVKRSRERGGTGLGLAIVKHILNRHHGRLQIESTPGVGSTFTVFLPLAATPSEEAAANDV